MYPRTKLKNIYTNTKITIAQQNKTHNAWQPIKISMYTKKQENMAHDQKKNQSIKTYSEITQMTELETQALKQLF